MTNHLRMLLTLVCALTLLNSRGVAAESSAPVGTPTTIVAGPDWVPLTPALDIEPGSALDFSALGLADAPAGKYGYVIARPDGQFAFERKPKRTQRFYGVNLCFGAHYMSKTEADRLAERLYRLGYNALRIHHYERDLVQGQPASTSPNPEKLDQFDYLMAALIQRGIYLTTDLYVSRPVPWREIGVERDGAVPMDTFKIYVPVHAGAYENWKKFSRALLDHKNPYTNRRYAEEPALALLAMINEGNFGNFFSTIKTVPEWKQAWNNWLAKKYAGRAALGSAWGKDLADDEDPVRQSVGWPERLNMDGLRARDCVAFLSDTEREMVLKMKRFLREEVGCRALVSNASSWTRFTTDQSARSVYDYVDDHFYVDHPQFLEGSWRLPSKCPNTNPLLEGASGGRAITFTRLFDKPFTVTEYNYSGPGRFRGVGGILTGAMGAMQGWGGVWRFAYSHSRNSMFTPSQMGYFDLASDPLSQAAERASLCLFLRGDLQTPSSSVALVMTEADLAKPAARIPTLAPRWHWLGWVTRIGTQVVPSPDTRLEHTALLPLGWQSPVSEYKSKQVLALPPYGVEDAQLVTALTDRGVLKGPAAADPSKKFFRSVHGEVTIDGPNGQLVLDTARTAGGYASPGQTIQTMKGGVGVRVEGNGATVWVSALDRNPIRTSKRLLVTHLTDLQNTGIRYAEEARQILQAWGTIPHLVRAGKAEVSIELKSARNYRVWALAPSGKRLSELTCKADGEKLRFTADVAGDAAAGARMLYEVALK